LSCVQFFNRTTNAPTKLAWVIALILGILGLIGELGSVPFLSDYPFWFMFAGWLLLVLATLLKGL
jgi:hypothetical protein